MATKKTTPAKQEKIDTKSTITTPESVTVTKTQTEPVVEVSSLHDSGVVTIEHIVDDKMIGLEKGRIVHDVAVESAKVMIEKGFAKLKNNHQ